MILDDLYICINHLYENEQVNQFSDKYIKSTYTPCYTFKVKHKATILHFDILLRDSNYKYLG